MFGSLVSTLDETLTGSAAPSLSESLQKTYNNFLTRLQAVVKECIENHVRGVQLYSNIPEHIHTYAPTASPATNDPRKKTLKNGALTSSRPSYANVTSQSKGKAKLKLSNSGLVKTHKQGSSTQIDHRIFLRLEKDATERLISSYPLLLQLRKFLGENASLLQEVQGNLLRRYRSR